MARNSWIRTTLSATIAFSLIGAGAVIFASPAAAASVIVMTEGDLQSAITTANANPGADQITLGANIDLTANLPLINGDLEIIGANFTIDAHVNGVFAVLGPGMTLRDITIKNSGAAYGLSAWDNNIVISNVKFQDSPVYLSGAHMSVTIANSSFNDSSLRAGLVLDVNDHSAVTIANSEFSRNLQGGLQASILQASTLSVTQATANNNDYLGFDIYGADGSTITTSNTVANSNDFAGYSFYLEGSTGSFTTSTAVGNGGYGFSAGATLSSTAVLSGLTSTSNAGDGVELFAGQDSTVTAKNITATLNDESSIYTDAEVNGAINVSDSTFNTSVTDFGAYVYTEDGASTTFSKVTFSGNAKGGMLISDVSAVSYNTVTIIDSTISGNSGPGIITDGALRRTSLLVNRSTISGNTGSDAGGIDAQLDNNSSITLSNSTISGNSGGLVGGVSVAGSGSATSRTDISHSTIVNNVTTDTVAGGPGGLGILSGQYTLSHSVVAGNTGRNGFGDFAADSGLGIATGTINYSLVQSAVSTAVTAIGAGTGNISNTAALLGPLANNGGSTRTHLPLDGSPLINAGNSAIVGAPATDQRGLARSVDTIDIGAVEVQRALAATGFVVPLPLVGGGALLLLAGGGVLLARRRSAKASV